MSTIDRGKASTIAAETVRILRAGHYTPPGGKAVQIAQALRAAVKGTVSYPPDATLPGFTLERNTTFEVANETTLDAARRLAGKGFRPVALNFASAKNPGGGFLNGARAQEESLCRSSGLYACIRGNPMYQFHAPTRGGFYTNYALYSPAVPVIRTDDGKLLPEPYLCSFVTAPAVNAEAYVRGKEPRREEVRKEMARRVDKVLTIMAGHGHDAAVLGAWGCGVFRNDPEEVAELFREALAGPFRGAFARVVFAVVDWSPELRFLGPFMERFGSGRTSQ